ncbi:cupin domain-containing protein [Paenibacillus sp. GSMTC-2017]|nr:cupin domain-containing protein [Paenibacillus sp. GSMTC-2017]
MLEESHDGQGFLRKVRAYQSNDFSTNIDFIDYIEVPPGVTIGHHQHANNEEIYFIVEGTGQMGIEDRVLTVESGNVIVNPVYGSHSLINTSQAVMKVFIFQVSK